MSKIRKLVFALFMGIAGYLFLFPASVTPSRSSRWIYDLLGPDYFPVYVRVLLGAGLLFIGWLLYIQVRTSKKIEGFVRRNSLLEGRKIIESEPRPDGEGRNPK